MERVLEPEWLDALSPSDARAAKARRDLRRVNALLGHAGILARGLRGALPRGAPPRVADLGTGDGRLLLALARRLRRPGFATLVDRHPAVDGDTLAAFRDVGWNIRVVAADATGFLQRTRLAFDAVIANLFLHHCDDAALEGLLAAAAPRTNAFVACEPRRGSAALAGSRLLWALGCGRITRHDAVVSVRAGFRGRELSQAWPAAGGWRLEEHRAGLFSHFFLALRRRRRRAG